MLPIPPQVIMSLISFLATFTTAFTKRAGRAPREFLKLCLPALLYTSTFAPLPPCPRHHCPNGLLCDPRHRSYCFRTCCFPHLVRGPVRSCGFPCPSSCNRVRELRCQFVHVRDLLCLKGLPRWKAACKFSAIFLSRWWSLLVQQIIAETSCAVLLQSYLRLSRQHQLRPWRFQLDFVDFLPSWVCVPFATSISCRLLPDPERSSLDVKTAFDLVAPTFLVPSPMNLRERSCIASLLLKAANDSSHCVKPLLCSTAPWSSLFVAKLVRLASRWNAIASQAPVCDTRFIGPRSSNQATPFRTALRKLGPCVLHVLHTPDTWHVWNLLPVFVDLIACACQAEQRALLPFVSHKFRFLASSKRGSRSDSSTVHGSTSSRVTLVSQMLPFNLLGSTQSILSCRPFPVHHEHNTVTDDYAELHCKPFELNACGWFMYPELLLRSWSRFVI